MGERSATAVLLSPTAADVVAEAGFARATSYKYFADQFDLLWKLFAEARVAAADLT